MFDGKLELPTRTAKHSDVLEIAREAFHAAAGPRPSERVAPLHRVPSGTLQNFGNDERGRRECDSESFLRISSGRSIEKFQMGDMAADYMGLATAALWIMQQ